jgi:ABC-type uncharacterized transport system involved in gliding motility auxiliary subunit
MDNQKSKLLYSTVGVIAVALILILANFVLGAVRQRVDLTDGRLYTLSAGTHSILDKLDQPLRIRFYFSQSDANVPLPLKAFGRRVEDLLAEYRSAGHGKITVEKFDPQPDSDAEDSATLDGVDAQQLPDGNRFYLGLGLSYGDRRLALPGLTLDREQLLEYDLSRAIAQAETKNKPVIGVMTPTNMFGSPGMPMMGMQPSQKQVFISELERDFAVRRVRMDADRIDDEIKVLVVIHPKDISDRAQYAIDQFVMRGGKLIAMVDPFSYFDAAANPRGGGGGTSSTLDPLFRAWGIKFDATRVVLDSTYVSGDGANALPTVLSLVGAAFNPDDITTSKIGGTLIPFGGAFTGTPAAGLKETVLMKSSKLSMLVDTAKATARGPQAMQDFKPSNIEYPLAIKLTGKFKTAYPDGQPPEPPKDKDAAAKPAAAAPPAPAQPSLKESPDTAVVLIGDADFVNDGAAVQIQEVFGQRVVVPANGNLAFAQAAVEQFAGDPALISLRSRAVAARPFTVIRDMEAQAQQAYLGKIQVLQSTLQQTQQKLQALQQARGPGQESSTILTPQQQAEIDNFRKISADTRRQLKDVRKELRRDSESLEFWTKVINIGAVPLLVAIAGIILAASRRRKTVKL